MVVLRLLAACQQIKFKLPGLLTPKHHLLLTVFHLNMSGSKVSHVPLGYAALPLASLSKTFNFVKCVLPFCVLTCSFALSCITPPGTFVMDAIRWL